jgi:hypothetical protein
MKGAAIAAGGFGVVVVALLAWVMIQTAITGTNPLAGQAERDAAPWILGEGDCFDDGPEWSRDTMVTPLGCDESHDSEVIAVDTFSTYGDDETPEDITAEAEGECAEPFTAYVESLPADSGVVLRVYHDGSPRYPVSRNPFRERRWDFACVAWSADGRFGRD